MKTQPLILIPILIICLSINAAQARNVNVTFQVNMRVMILGGFFIPDSDVVEVRGNFNNWMSFSPMSDPDHDSIYTFTIAVAADTVHEYKYFKTPGRGGMDWESNYDANRRFTALQEDLVLPVQYFNNETEVKYWVTGTVRYRVDMGVMAQLGIFRPQDGDRVEIRGAFNGWTDMDPANSILEHIPGTDSYFITTPDSGYSHDIRRYVFFLDIPADRLAARWPGQTVDTNAFRYESPFSTGGGPRSILLAPGLLDAPFYYFNSLPPSSIIPAGDTVAVTFRYNMKPALSFAPAPFVPERDTLYLNLENGIWNTMQGYPNPWTNLRFTREDDSIWTLTVPFAGPMTSGIMYRVRYTQPGGGDLLEGGGLGVDAPYRVRYIHCEGSSWPAAQTFDVDLWQRLPPMPVERRPFAITISGASSLVDAVPKTSALAQNYPNPFNPSTNLRFRLAEAGPVKIIIYSVLGQEVARIVDELLPAGEYERSWNAAALASGQYFCRMITPHHFETRKLLLLK